MTKPRMLDLFCGAGGAARGYQMAGFHVTGVDIKPQPRYAGDVFIQGDALNPPVRFEEFDAIHASPPCQAYTAGKNMWKGRLPDDRHPDLVAETRAMLEASGRAYIIENVVGTPLRDAVMLCGTAFGLGVIRHRLFETNFPAWGMPCASHGSFTVSVFGGGALSRTPVGGGARVDGRHAVMQRRVHVPHRLAKVAMGIDWMTRGELSEAIPPAYTEFLGQQLLDLRPSSHQKGEIA